MYDRTFLLIGCDFIVLGFVFAITGIRVLNRLSFYFSEFYQQNKVALIVIVIGMVLSLMARGILDLLFGLDRDGNISLHMHDYEIVYNLIKFLILDMIPISF